MYTLLEHIFGVMDSVLTLSEVDRGFDFRSGQTKDFEIGMCCFSAKHIVWRRKSKDWFARNQYNVSVCGYMSTHELSFQWASTIKIQLSMLVYYKEDLIITSLKINLVSPRYSWKNCWIGVKQQSLTHAHPYIFKSITETNKHSNFKNQFIFFRTHS
jgi:hypothetical protein